MIREMDGAQRSFRRCGPSPSVVERERTHLLHGRRGCTTSDRRHATMPSIRVRSCCSYLRGDRGYFQLIIEIGQELGGVQVRRREVFNCAKWKCTLHSGKGIRVIMYNICLYVCM